MPRRPRIILPGVPLHVIQRGNNRQACFFADADYRRFLEFLREYAGASRCAVHAFVLMTNHVHLLLSATTSDAAAALMKALGQRYTQYVNRARGRSGTLWEGRFRSCLVQEEAYLLACQRYIELNPVRAGMVAMPGDYRWSSYAANADGAASELVEPHPLYLRLGTDPAERRAAYRALFESPLEPGVVDGIRRATNGNVVLGDPRFADAVSGALGRRASPGRPGRPRRPDVADPGVPG